MFKSLFIALFITFIGSTQTLFPIEDEDFVIFLQKNYPSAMEGNKLNIDAPILKRVDEIKLNSLYLHDINGIQYFTNLKSLECIENSLWYLPELPKKLKRLDCSLNLIERLPNLPSSLEELSCAQNLLKDLPELPENLTILYCNFNQISVLPTLPNSLEYLACGSNKLTCLPTLPPTIFIGDIALNPFECLASHEEWMDENSLKLPICEFSTDKNAKEQCVCVSKTIVSVEEEARLEGLNIDNINVSIFPNPAREKINIRAEEIIEEVVIRDMNGQVVFSSTFNSTQIRINLVDFKEGIYFVQTKMNSKFITSKIVKSN